jgi:hypothetical protein
MVFIGNIVNETNGQWILGINFFYYNGDEHKLTVKKLHWLPNAAKGKTAIEKYGLSGFRTATIYDHARLIKEIWKNGKE